MDVAAAKSNRLKKIAFIAVDAVLLAVLLLVGISDGFQKLLYPIHYKEQVERYGAQFGVDPLLVYTVIKTESGFDPGASSGAGARGLMQMTEDTFEWLRERLAPGEDLGFDDLYDPEVSIRFGTYLLALSLERFGGDVPTAAAAYHSGWGTVGRLLESADYSADGVRLSRFPYRQMGHYVRKINRNYAKYKTLYA